MYAKEYDSFMPSVQQALTLPIKARCAELSILLDRASLLELHSFFPILIDSIFGPQGTPCWGLRSITEMQCDDFRQLVHFLSPCGPFFKLIYNLLKDPNIKYDFSLSYLPSKIRQFLETTSGHPFYSELVHYSPQTKQIISLLLNPFDYYMFHFAYHLINPWQQRSGAYVTSWNTAYYVLACEYILHFLPTDPSVTITPVIYYNGKNPNKALSTKQVTDALASINSPTHLVSSVGFSKQMEEAFHNNLDRHHPRNDIWRSETVLTVFADMWLHNDQVNESNSSACLNDPLKSSPSRMLHYNELPTGEYMRIVRVLIKHLHSFSASAKADDTHLSELKKIAIPMIQGKFYVFLRNLIHRWPIDGSFRLVLELWLSYIQPWRYPPQNLVKTRNKQETNPDLEDLTMGTQNAVDREHIQFIAENLLTYVVIFQQLIPRFCRVDLISPKISLMLYRIAKVFGQPNLATYIREVEQCVENNRPSPTHHRYTSDWTNNLPPLSPTSNWCSNIHANIMNLNAATQTPTSVSFAPSLNSTFLNTTYNERKWSAIVKQKIFELEGPNFCYKPLFSDPPASEVYDLLVQIKRSITQARAVINMKEQEERELYSGFWGSIKYLFHTSATNDEFTLEDRKKVPLYLEISYANLKQIFNVEQEIQEVEVDQTASSNTNGFEMTTDFKFLTPEKVRNRIKTIKYEGDPDLHPIRSDECAFLVRALYQLACKVNETFGPTFYQLYYAPTFWGRLSREILCPPITTYYYEKSVMGSPRLSKNLPPRVSFRFMASYTFIFYFVLSSLTAYMLGYRLEVFWLFLIALYLLYKTFKALFRTSDFLMRQNYPTQGFRNISFNDSF